MIDTHCHLNDNQFAEDLNKVIDNYLEVGVSKVVCVGCDEKSNIKGKEIASQNESVYYSVGIHPDDCETYNEQKLEQFLINKDKKLVAIGEIGLDYFRTKENSVKQKQVFISQLNLAVKYSLPVIIHCRDAYGDILPILQEYSKKLKIVMHCYSGSLEFAQILIKLGVKISFTGNVTFKNAVNVQNVATNLPLDSFFFETDCPYLAPTGHRGERNQPAFVPLVAEFVANLRNISKEQLIEITDKNAQNFFNFQ